MTELKFIADANVGKLGRWLRMVGFDALLFEGTDDADMVEIALNEERIILTRDTGVVVRRVIANGQVKGILVKSDKLPDQIQQVIDALQIGEKQLKPLIRCIECNQALIPIKRSDIKDRVPPYVYRTQKQFVECPICHRIYWKGTHWQAMRDRIENVVEYSRGRDKNSRDEPQSPA